MMMSEIDIINVEPSSFNRPSSVFVILYLNISSFTAFNVEFPLHNVRLQCMPNV
jgi:hypothetical protein